MSPSLEALIERITSESDPAEVGEARAAFTARTGDFAPEDAFHEERVRAAFEDAAVHFRDGALTQRFLARGGEPRARALLASWRSLFSVRAVPSHARVVGLLGHAELDVVRDEGPAGRLREGDLFVGRLTVDEGVRLLPGALFFERDGHAAILDIAARAAAEGRGSDATCDALLRMQMRLFRQPSLRPHHVFRWDAFDERGILAAPWARKR